MKSLIKKLYQQKLAVKDSELKRSAKSNLRSKYGGIHWVIMLMVFFNYAAVLFAEGDEITTCKQPDTGSVPPTPQRSYDSLEACETEANIYTRRCKSEGPYDGLEPPCELGCRVHEITVGKESLPSCTSVTAKGTTVINNTITEVETTSWVLKGEKCTPAKWLCVRDLKPGIEPESITAEHFECEHEDNAQMCAGSCRIYCHGAWRFSDIKDCTNSRVNTAKEDLIKKAEEAFNQKFLTPPYSAQGNIQGNPSCCRVENDEQEHLPNDKVCITRSEKIEKKDCKKVADDLNSGRGIILSIEMGLNCQCRLTDQ